MDPKEALIFIDQVVSNMNGTRAQHAQITEALQSLDEVVQWHQVFISTQSPEENERIN